RTFSVTPRCGVPRAPAALLGTPGCFADGGPFISACSADLPPRETIRRLVKEKAMQVSPPRLGCARRADDLVGLRGSEAPPWPGDGWNAGWPPFSPLMWRATRIR